MSVVSPFYMPLGYVQQTALSAAVGLSAVPVGATNATIYVEGAGIRWRDDGTAPTASVGMPVASGAAFSYTGNFNNLKIIQQAAGAIINVSYYTVS